MAYIKTYDELFFTDDFLFSRIMRNPEIAKGVVESLLSVKVDHIKFLTTQHTIDESFNSHGIRLDVYLEDSDKVIDVEMQTEIRKDEGLRMRYYQSLIDIEHLNSGQNYKELKESYILFICLNDPFGYGKPVYRFSSIEEENGFRLNDRMHKVIYNASGFDKAADENVRALLSYITNRKSSDQLTDRIQTAVDTSKNHQPWRAEYMLWRDQIAEWKEDAHEAGWAEGHAEGRAEGRAEGEVAGKLSDAENLLKLNVSLDIVLQATGLSNEQIKPILEKLGK